jgi:protease I
MRPDDLRFASEPFGPPARRPPVRVTWLGITASDGLAGLSRGTDTPVGLIESDLSAYPACAPEVRAAGGKYADIPVDKAHVDGNLVTAPAWPAHPAWLAQFLKLLGTRIEL